MHTSNTHAKEGNDRGTNTPILHRSGLHVKPVLFPVAKVEVISGFQKNQYKKEICVTV